jgi:hypothetical protein
MSEIEPALTRDWFSLSRLEQIAKRHELWNSCGLPNDEYAASWNDVKVLLDRVRELEQLNSSDRNSERGSDD